MCSGDHTVKIIDWETGSCLNVLIGHRRTPWVVSLPFYFWPQFLFINLIMQLLLNTVVNKILVGNVLCLDFCGYSLNICKNFIIILDKFCVATCDVGNSPYKLGNAFNLKMNGSGTYWLFL